MTSNGIREFKKWLVAHPDITSNKYSIDEIVNLAIACGFDRLAVAQWATSQKFKAAAQ